MHKEREYYLPLAFSLLEKKGHSLSEFVGLAHLLQLPEKDEQDQNLIVEAVMRWLRVNTHSCGEPTRSSNRHLDQMLSMYRIV